MEKSGAWSWLLMLGSPALLLFCCKNAAARFNIPHYSRKNVRASLFLALFMQVLLTPLSLVVSLLAWSQKMYWVLFTGSSNNGCCQYIPHFYMFQANWGFLLAIQAWERIQEKWLQNSILVRFDPGHSWHIIIICHKRVCKTLCEHSCKIGNILILTSKGSTVDYFASFLLM